MATKPITEREVITDHIADVMHELCPSWSIDTLNAHPLEAARVYAVVCNRAGKVSNAKLRQVEQWLKTCPLIVGDDRSLWDQIHNVARIGLASRKRGDLKMDRY